MSIPFRFKLSQSIYLISWILPIDTENKTSGSILTGIDGSFGPGFTLWHLNKHKFPDILENDKIIDRYSIFLNSLPYYYKLDDYYLVHAGFNFRSDTPFEDKKAMLWTHYFNPPEGRLNGKRIIHGHDPLTMEVILEHIEKGYPTIPLDNGAVYAGKHKIYDTSQMGRLCAYNMDDNILHTQDNIDIK